MKKSATFVPAFVAVMALSAYAQVGVQTVPERKETLKVNVSGGFDVDWVFRGKELTAVLGGSGADEGRIESDASLTFDIDLSNKVSVMMTMRSTRLNGDYSNIGQLGNGGQNVELWDLAIKLGDVLDPGLTTQLGTNNDFMFDPRGRGSALFFAPGAAGTFGANTGGELNYNQVAGAVLRYDRESMHFALALLPAIQEGGPASNDEAAYAVTFMYDMDNVGKGSRLGAILAFDTLPAVGGSSTSSIITIGLGASLKDLLSAGLELFGEFYFQSGDVGDGDAGGTALNIGGRFNFDMDSQPWVEVSVTMLSGDDDPADADVDQFMSYESVNDFAIVESNITGVNLGTNMLAIKFMGGLGLTVGNTTEKNNLTLGAGVGLFTAVEDIAVGGPIGTTDEIGMELDIKASYWYSKQVSLDLTLAFLVGSEVLEASNVDEEDSTMLFSFGVNGRF
jgi:hypothetical protein